MSRCLSACMTACSRLRRATTSGSTPSQPRLDGCAVIAFFVLQALLRDRLLCESVPLCRQAPLPPLLACPACCCCFHASLPPLVQVLHFCVPQVVTCEGCYSGGRVTVVALPEELLGSNNRHTWPLRRVEGKAGDCELRDHVTRELAKVRCAACASARVYVCACVRARLCVCMCMCMCASLQHAIMHSLSQALPATDALTSRHAAAR